MLTVLLILLVGIGIAERWWKYATIVQFMQRAVPDHAKTHRRPTVSVVQPIVSGDPTMFSALEDNLRFRTQFDIEFLWMLDDDDHAAIQGCRKLSEQYPQRAVQIILLPSAPSHCSPKTFKLMEGFKRAKGDILVALDDDTALPDGALERSLPFLEEAGVGVVFGVPYYVSFQNLWSSLVSAFVNANSVWIYIPYTQFVDPFAINGMFFAMKRTVYDSVGGFDGIESSICDDYAMAQRMIKHGLRLVEAPLLHPIRIQVRTMTAYLNIIQRWFVFTRASVMTADVRNLIAFYFVVFVPTFFPLSVLILAILAHSHLAALLCAGYFAVFAGFLWRVNVQLLNRATPLAHLPLLVLTNLLAPTQVIWTLATPKRITWRGNVMHISPDGQFKLVEKRTFS